MWNNQPDVREMVTKIEITSDRIVERLKVSDLSVNALRRLKEDIATIRSATDETLRDYRDVLSKIQNYINEAVLDPDSLEFCAERVHDHVKAYLLEHSSFNEGYEADRDKAIRGRIAMKRTIAEIEQTEERKKAIEEDWIINSYSSDSPRYIALVSEHSGLSTKIENLKYKLSVLQKMNAANQTINSAVERKQSTENAAAGITMSSKEYSSILSETRELEQELFAELEAFKIAESEVAFSPVSLEIDDSDFRHAVEETLLERMYRSNAESYETQVAAMPKDELFGAMLCAIRKVDDLEGLVKSSNEEMKKQAAENLARLEALLADTSNIAAMREDMSADVEKEVQYCLARTPADLQSAHLKIRNCIELYCRFRKGIDLNDKFFCNNLSVEAKFAVANKTEYDKEISQYYKNSNGFVHNSNDIISMTEAENENEAKKLAQIAARLHSLGIDKYDFTEGIKLHYITRDQMLKQRIDDGQIDREFVEAERNTKGRLYYDYFGPRIGMSRFMEEHNIDIPQINFASIKDVEAYLDSKEGIAEQSKATKAVEEKPTAVTSVPTGKSSQRLESIISTYLPDRKFGFIQDIENPDNKKGIYFRPDGDDTGFVKGAKVSFVMGRNAEGTCAKQVRLVASAEVTD